jgi:hypothetical protein
MRPGDLPAKEGEVFAIKKFKPDKEGDVQTYAGVSQSGAREIMVSEREAGRLERRSRDAVRHKREVNDSRAYW